MKKIKFADVKQLCFNKYFSPQDIIQACNKPEIGLNLTLRCMIFYLKTDQLREIKNSIPANSQVIFIVDSILNDKQLDEARHSYFNA